MLGWRRSDLTGILPKYNEAGGEFFRRGLLNPAADILAVLRQQISTFPVVQRYCLAYSGGADSQVLLHALMSLGDALPATLSVLHIDHCWHPQHADWAEFCQAQCAALHIPYKQLQITASCPRGESPEAWYRAERYRLLFAETGVDGLLLTAHHADDQAETVLLQLLRGAGPRGLAAMPTIRHVQGVWHGRPLRNLHRAALRAYAKQHALLWIEDGSNKDEQRDRNYLRHRIMPILTARWPAATRVFSRAASHQAEVCTLLDDLAALDQAKIAGNVIGTLSRSAVAKLSAHRIKNVLRYWLHKQGLTTPTSRQLMRVLHDLIWPQQMLVQSCVCWHGASVYAYDDNLYAFSPLPVHDVSGSILWDFPATLSLPMGGRISVAKTHNIGIKECISKAQQLEIRYRQGGEKIQLLARSHHSQVKELLRLLRVPPWLRDRIPLLFVDGELAAVIGYWIDVRFLSEPGASAWELTWHDARFVPYLPPLIANI